MDEVGEGRVRGERGILVWVGLLEGHGLRDGMIGCYG